MRIRKENQIYSADDRYYYTAVLIPLLDTSLSLLTDEHLPCSTRRKGPREKTRYCPTSAQ